MSFEDDKDILDSSNSVSDDDLISWDSVIDTDEDGIVSIKKSAPENMETEVFTNDSSYSDTDTINLDDMVVNEDSPQPSDNINEDELKLILNRDTSDGVEYIDDTEIEDSEELDKILMDNDTSAMSGSTTTIGVESDEEITPRKDEVTKKATVSPLLLIILLGMIAVTIIYIIYSSFLNKESKDDQSMQNELIQNEQIRNDQSEDISAGEDIRDIVDNQNGDIPVVNEDEASDLKPEENQEEKKEVVSVVPTGRTDPFAPLQKYVNVKTVAPVVPPSVVVKTINNIDMDSIQIPKPPKAYGELNEIAEKLMSISVTGIMYDKLKPSAIINYEGNDYFVQIGDKLNNFKVIDIGPSDVKIALGKNVYKAEVGERFKIQSEFFGNNQYLEGTRQYYSSKDEFDNRAKNAKKYTSNDDVKIYTK